jgi:hypothetical protein
MQPTLLSDIVLATPFGLATAYISYRLLGRSRSALRLIDLISFALGFLAIGAGLFSAYRYQQDMSKAVEHLNFHNLLGSMKFHIAVDQMKLCERAPHTPYRISAQKKKECDQLEQYVSKLSIDTTIPAELWPPILGFYTDADVRAMAERVASSIVQINASIKAYRDESYRGFQTQWLEALFRELMLPVLAFAFGLGGGRRMIDLYLDLPPRLKKWMRYQCIVRTRRGADVRFISSLIAAG